MQQNFNHTVLNTSLTPIIKVTIADTNIYKIIAISTSILTTLIIFILYV